MKIILQGKHVKMPDVFGKKFAQKPPFKLKLLLDSIMTFSLRKNQPFCLKGDEFHDQFQ